MREKLYAPLKIAAVVQVLGEAGVEARTILAGTGLSADAIVNPNTKTSIEQLLIVGGNIIRLRPILAVGPMVGQRLHVTRYGMYGYALLCAGTMRRAFDFAVRYHQLATPVMRIGWSADNEKAAWEFPNHDEMLPPDLGPDLYRFFLEM